MQRYKLFGILEILLSSIILILVLLFTYALKLYESLFLLLIVSVYLMVGILNVKFGLSIYKKKRSITDGLILLSVLVLLISFFVSMLGGPSTQTLHY